MSTTGKLRIEELPALRIARVSVESEDPEIKAFQALVNWAKKNELEPLDGARFFGFNDPCPEPGQAVYEYEAWITVSENANGEGDVSIRTHPGGQYAVTVTKLSEIGQAWDQLSSAVKSSRYEFGSGPALEEPLMDPTTTPFDKAEMKLYLPIR